jgi:3-deoxy-D-manno-octulosonic-acid transferase
LYFLYSVLLAVGFVLAAPVYLWRGRATGKYLETFRERMGRLPASVLAASARAAGEPSIWVHAVSVGEVLAARPLVAALKERFPSRLVFLSTTTLTGRAVAEKNVRAADGLFFAPYDWPAPVRRALRELRPGLLVLMETEIWPNLIHEARRSGARVAMVNGRISRRSHAGYVRIRALLRRVLREVDLFLMQGEAHAQRITDMGAPPDRVRVTGNLKFDALGATVASEALEHLLGSPGHDRPLVVAGSTMEGEEEPVLAAFQRVREQVPGTRFLLAPRHPERFDAVSALVEKAGFRCRRRTGLGAAGWPPEEVLVLDTLGELAQVYPLADVVFVGGSLVPTGGHNILEAAVAGKPVVVGPHMHNFQEIADRFRAEGALVEVASAGDLGRELTRLVTDEARRRELGERGRAIVEKNRGAVATTIDALASLLA